MMRPYRLLIADDHILFRELIKKNLEEVPGLEVVGEVGDGLELLETLKVITPDLIILDIAMPRLTGLEAAKKIKMIHPQIKILLLTMYKSEEHLKQALNAKIEGYLLKENAFNDLINAIKTIRGGEFYISEILSELMVRSLKKKFEEESQKSELLSGREKEVVKYFAEGKSNKEIADLLSITESTVRNHIFNIKIKLSLKRNIDLMKYAIKEGYASIK
jgi:DNA-binding NarL/FixJ family response regulator